MIKMKKYLPLAILAIAIFLRLSYVVFYPQMPLVNDPSGYDKTGWGLVNGKGFPVFELDNEVIISRPPGYPVFLAVIYNTFGHAPQAVRVFQAILDSLVCLVVFYLGLKLFNSTIGYLAAILYAFYIPPIIFSGLLYSEILFTFILSVCILFLFLAIRTDRFKYWIGAGLFLGAATLISTRSLYMPLFIFAAIFLNNRSIKKSLKRLGIMITCMLVLFSPWTLRNYLATGKVILLDNIGSSGASLLWLATNPYGAIDWDMSSEPMKSRFAHLTEEERVKIFKKEALSNLKQYPLAYARNSFKRFGLFWFSSFSYHIYGFEKSFSAAWQERNCVFLLFKFFLFGLNALFVMLGFFGLWVIRRKWKRPYFIILAPIIYFVLIDTFYVATPRHQVPIIPYMIIFASVGIISILRPDKIKA